ncbi:two-component hybrid sensor and regulator [Cylindrospermum sp. NIES-4074]|nr:two-component hybrid sensor and regulator [Cylindrospermum sp. NIES-4074]
MISVIDERSPALSLGAFEYLVKPINREQFRQIIERLRHPEDSPINALIIAPTVAPIEVTCPPLILLAEDNEANVTTISCYLEARGYRLILAKNGEDAVTLTKIQNPDLILMDIQMPKLDGLKAIRQIRAEQDFIHTPIIALTALAMPKDWEDCMEAGANHYFTKPVKLKLLVETIQNLLNQM